MAKQLVLDIQTGVHCPDSLAVPRRSPGVFSLALPGIVLVLVCLIPYLNKAYTIDDTCFLNSARQILRQPLRPWSSPGCWFATWECFKNPANVGLGSTEALMGYVLVPVIATGGHEWLAHLLQILFAVFAVLGMVRLALRLGFDPLQAGAAGLMLVSIPPFLAMASTAMPDVLALSLGVNGLERLLAWRDEGRWHQAVAAALTLGLAPYARPHLALLLPLGALWIFRDYRPLSALKQFLGEFRLWAPIFAAGFLLILILWLTHEPGPPVGFRDLVANPVYVPGNLHAYLLYLAFPIPFAAVVVGVQFRKTPLFMLLPIVPAIMHHITRGPSYALWSEWSSVATFLATAALGCMLYNCIRRPDRLTALLFLWILVPLVATVYHQFPIKYLLPVTPAVVLIAISRLATLDKRTAMAYYGALILICCGFSCVLLRADADFAEYGRRASAELIRPHVAAGERVWFAGELGFYWYAETAGAKPVGLGDEPPRAGDLLAVGIIEHGGVVLNRFPKRELVEAQEYDSPHGRIAGLYANRIADALWAWEPAATNRYELWRIR